MQSFKDANELLFSWSSSVCMVFKNGKVFFIYIIHFEANYHLIL